MLAAHCPLSWACPQLLRIRLYVKPSPREAGSPFTHLLLLLPPWLSPRVTSPPPPASDVLDMVDVLVEGSEGLDEEIGCSLSEDMALLTFPFSPVAPAALEARNKLLLGTEREAGACVGRRGHRASWAPVGGRWGSRGLGIIAENPPK